MLDKVLFRTKDWQLFLTFVGLWIIEVGFGSRVPVALLGGCILWMVLVGLRLKNFLPPRYRTPFLIFRVSVSMIILSLAALFFAGTANTDTMMFLGLLAYVSYISIATFVARAIRSLETQDLAKFSDYAVYIFMLLAFPIGVWFIQPRLNLLGKEVFFR